MDEGVEDNSFMLILDHLKGDESSRQWSLIMGFLWCGGVMGKYAAGELKPPSTDFHKKLVGEKGIGFDKWDMSKKKDFTENKPKEDKCQALVSRMKGGKCTRDRVHSFPEGSLKLNVDRHSLKDGFLSQSMAGVAYALFMLFMDLCTEETFLVLEQGPFLINFFFLQASTRGSGKHPQLIPSTPRWAVANGAGVILSVCDEEVARYETATLTAAAVPALLLPPPTTALDEHLVAGLPALEPYARLFHRYYAIATPSATQRLLLGLLEAPPSWAPDALDAAVQLVELLRAAEDYASGMRVSSIISTAMT
ncbi:Protein GIGANTEA [Vitis vinifera]|uniref:Protein GIGANTEA n=1 Tax=Vitis vinifera TaxID=29760 RepID=A0A438DPQ1_VITVI|nr:Protein GIGANTEA [Vitis vinifera]